jgi:hypothetical protein
VQRLVSGFAKSLFAFFALSFLNFSITLAAESLPKNIQLTYAVTKNGQPFATVRESFTVTGSSYKVESATKGIGVYALFGVRQLTSEGEVTNAGLQPKKFELHQGNDEKKALLTTFDWQNNQLTMLVKGKERKSDLVAGTQDLASFAYQFMFQPQVLHQQIALDLTTGKKLNHYQYEVAQESINILGKTSPTYHLTPAKNDKLSSETKELWLSAEYHYLPVKILLVDEYGQKLEQNLVEFNAN